MATSEEFASYYRTLKVCAMVAAMDKVLTLMNIDQASGAALDYVESLEEPQWKLIEDFGHCKTPCSATTRGLVLAVYAERAANSFT